MKSAKGQTAFVYSGAEIWNSLPLRIKEARSIDLFQERLKNIFSRFSRLRILNDYY